MPPKRDIERLALVEKENGHHRDDIERLEKRTANLESSMGKIAVDVEILTKSTVSLTNSVEKLCKTLDAGKWAVYGALALVIFQQFGLGGMIKAFLSVAAP